MLIFDLDGTLLNTAKDLQVALNHALRAHGFPEKSEPETCGNCNSAISKWALFPTNLTKA